MTQDSLFSRGRLSDNFEVQRRGVQSMVDRIPRETFIATSDDTLAEHLLPNLLWDPLELVEDQIQMDRDEAQVDVTGRVDYDVRAGRGRVMMSGHTLSFFVPYRGTQGLWELQPNMYLSVMPRAEVGPGKLVIRITRTANADPQEYQNEFQQQMSGIRQLVQAQRSMVEQHNTEMEGAVRQAIQARREHIRKMDGLAAVFPFPLVKKPGAPEFRAIEVQRRIARPLPRVAAAGLRPEPAISPETYQDVLALIRHAGASFEGTPQTYSQHGEEGLRDIILSHINAAYEGRATGETFNKYGKTDIRLMEENRAAFIGECKVWGGEKLLLEALDQLLGYLTWRDSKAALIVFNKDVAGFSQVQQKIPAALTGHPGFLRVKNSQPAGEWRMVFKSKEDEGREVTVHTFAFNVYVSDERKSKKR